MDIYNENLKSSLKTLLARIRHIKALREQLDLLSEWETTERFRAIEIGIHFFSLVKYDFYKSLILELCLLFDEREDFSIIKWLNKVTAQVIVTDWMDFKYYFGKKSNKQKHFSEIISTQQTDIKNRAAIINNLKEIRDKTIAHVDKEYFANPDLVYKAFPFSKEDELTLLNLADDILCKHYCWAFNADLDNFTYNSSSIDRVLKYARAYERILHDKRAKNLHPGCYIHDNFEDRLAIVRSQNDVGSGD